MGQRTTNHVSNFYEIIVILPDFKQINTGLISGIEIETNGYLLARANGGLNQMKTGVSSLK